MKFDVKTQGKKMEVALEGRMDSATAPGFEKEIFQKLDGVTELVLDFTDLAYLSECRIKSCFYPVAEENECSKGKYGCKACQ